MATAYRTVMPWCLRLCCHQSHGFPPVWKSTAQISETPSEVRLLPLLKKLQTMFQSHPTQLLMTTVDQTAEQEEQQGAPVDKKWVPVSSGASSCSTPLSFISQTLPTPQTMGLSCTILSYFIFLLDLLLLQAPVWQAFRCLMCCKHIIKEIVNF